MAQFPALPLWTDAYLADTNHLTAIEHGAYLMLLVTMWRNGGVLPNDDKKLARFARLNRTQWERMKPTILEFMTVSDDGQLVTQGRLTDELQYVRDHAKKQSKNARSRWQNETVGGGAVKREPHNSFNGKRSNTLISLESGYATAMPDGCQTDAPTPTPTVIIEDTNVSSLSETAVPDGGKASKRNVYPADFEAVWFAFPRTPNMSKAEALPAWRKLSAEDRALVLPSIPAYIAYLKANPNLETIHFCRYLSKRRFEGFAPMPKECNAAEWQKRLIYARSNGVWSTGEWGPMPGQTGCLAPDAMVSAGDGVGWKEWSHAA